MAFTNTDLVLLNFEHKEAMAKHAVEWGNRQKASVATVAASSRKQAKPAAKKSGKRPAAPADAGGDSSSSSASSSASCVERLLELKLRQQPGRQVPKDLGRRWQDPGRVLRRRLNLR